MLLPYSWGHSAPQYFDIRRVPLFFPFVSPFHIGCLVSYKELTAIQLPHMIRVAGILGGKQQQQHYFVDFIVFSAEVLDLLNIIIHFDIMSNMKPAK